MAPKDIETIKINKSPKYAALVGLMGNPQRLLATILVANNFVNVAIILIFTYVIDSLFHFTDIPVLGFLCEVVLITVVILLAGEIVPKVYAGVRPLKTAVFFTPTLVFLSALFKPLTMLLVKSTSLIDKRLSNKNQNFSIEELADAIDIAVDEAAPYSEKNFLKHIVTFGKIEVSEVMRSRMDVIAIDKNNSFEQVMKVIIDSGYSRMPVYSETLDTIVGVLHIKDVLPYFDHADFKWNTLIRTAFFVPENKKLDDILQDFKQLKRHLAIVVDEYGGTAGIITLEDVLEEIVGDIHDEFDSDNEDQLYHTINDHEWIFEAKISLNDFCKVVNIDRNFFESLKKDSESLGGLILEHTGELPKKYYKLQIAPFTLSIESVDSRRIKKVRVIKL
ncbi:hemolysin [Bacteroidia bacterium]|nr:hemolysin [Bacteroidia bacterium]